MHCLSTTNDYVAERLRKPSLGLEAIAEIQPSEVRLAFWTSRVAGTCLPIPQTLHVPSSIATNATNTAWGIFMGANVFNMSATCETNRGEAVPPRWGATFTRLASVALRAFDS